MNARWLCAAVLAATAAVAAAQTTTPPPTTTSKKSATKLVTAVGCVGQDPSHAGTFTLTDLTTGSTIYKVAGKDVREYLGKRVSITGSAVRPKLAIVGGLAPSPNVAAQAGAIDPTRAAMAAQGAEGDTRPGQIAIPELRVRSLKAVAGDCERR